MGAADAASPKRPDLTLPGDGAEVIPFFTRLSGVLRGQDLYVKNNRLVVPSTKEGKPSLYFPSAVTLSEEIERCVRFVRKRKKKVTRIDDEGNKVETEEDTTTTHGMPDKLAKKCYESETVKNTLREIRQMESVRLPVTRKDGTLELLDEGYDSEALTYTVDGIDYRQDMTLEDAKRFLDNLFGEFDFSDKRSYSVVLALALSEYCRYLFTRGVLRPGVATQANSQGAGKTLALTMALGAVHGLVPTVTLDRTIEAQEKKLYSIFSRAGRVVLYDNVEGYCNSAVISQILTSPIWTSRTLGVSEMTDVRHEAQICLSGNNLRLGKCFIRRFLVCDLRQLAEDPRKNIKKNPFSEAYFERKRPEFLAALWALVREWDKAKRPEGPKMASFEEWSSVIGGILINAGYTNPIEIVDDSEVDADGVDIKILLKAIRAGISDAKGPATNKESGLIALEIRNHIAQEELFADRLADLRNPSATGAAVGLILKSWVDRTCGGLVLKYHGHAARRKWWVEEVPAK